MTTKELRALINANLEECKEAYVEIENDNYIFSKRSVFYAMVDRLLAKEEFNPMLPYSTIDAIAYSIFNPIIDVNITDKKKYSRRIGDWASLVNKLDYQRSLEAEKAKERELRESTIRKLEELWAKNK